MKLIIEIMGCGLIVLALIHAVFPKVFDWKKELAGLSLINQQLMTVHTFFIALAVFLNGLLCVTCADELMNTSLGRKLCLGLSFSVYLVFSDRSIPFCWLGRVVKIR